MANPDEKLPPDPLKGWNHFTDALARGVPSQMFQAHVIRRHALAKLGYYSQPKTKRGR